MSSQPDNKRWSEGGGGGQEKDKEEDGDRERERRRDIFVSERSLLGLD